MEVRSLTFLFCMLLTWNHSTPCSHGRISDGRRTAAPLQRAAAAQHNHDDDLRPNTPPARRAAGGRAGHGLRVSQVSAMYISMDASRAYCVVFSRNTRRAHAEVLQSTSSNTAHGAAACLGRRWAAGQRTRSRAEWRRTVDVGQIRLLENSAGGWRMGGAGGRRRAYLKKGQVSTSSMV